METNSPDSSLRYFADIYRSIRSGSAMAPFIAITILSCIFGCPLILFGNVIAQFFAIILVIICFTVTIIKGFYFMKNDPTH